MTSKGSSDNFFDASTEPPDSLGPKPTSSHNVLIRGNTPAHGLGEPVHVEAELSKGDRTATARTKHITKAINSQFSETNQAIASARAAERRHICISTMVMLFTMTIMAAGCVAIIFTRETHVDDDHGLRDNDGTLVSTSRAIASLENITALPTLGPFYKLSLIHI